jgi:hypothetical protein
MVSAGTALRLRFIRRDDPHHQWSTAMAWVVLFAAGVLEVGWAVGLKYTEGLFVAGIVGLKVASASPPPGS